MCEGAVMIFLWGFIAGVILLLQIEKRVMISKAKSGGTYSCDGKEYKVIEVTNALC